MIRIKNTAGFTLIEMVVVISLVVMLMLAATTLFYATLLSNSKATVTQTVKNEGTYALGQMEFLLRNAVQLLPNGAGQTCAANMDEITFRSYDNGTTSLFAETDPGDGQDKIASNSGVYLTSQTVDLIAGPTFNCTQSSDGSSNFVEIRFTIRKGTPGIDRDVEIVQQEFSTRVNLRSN